MTEIRLHDTRSREKRAVVPDARGRVGMYVCGPTVYDRAHIGNARPVVVFDVLYRLLRHVHGAENVTYVRNFTDVDDKIIARAAGTRQPGESEMDAIARITRETTAWYLEDMDALGALRPTHMPRATDYVANPEQPVDMVRLIERLIEQGHAYEAEGHVLFSVASWAPYGTLSRRSTDELLAGARVDVAPYKRSPMDFVLWKPSTPEQPGWDSPWGRGRPGWHIECSAMAKAILGDTFQIHGGGIDLVFPHHENERAQSCCANGTEELADIWMHNGYLMVEGEKMSKSLGNFVTVKDLRDRGVPGEAIRLALLMTHYRQPLDWTGERRMEAEQTLDFWAKRLARYEEDEIADLTPDDVPDHLVAALSDDLNTPEAIHALTGIAKKARRDRRPEGRALAAGAHLLGLDLSDLPAYRQELARQKAHRGEISPAVDDAFTETENRERIAALLRAREEARKAKDFRRADAIRDGLVAAGLELRDGASGTTFSPTSDFDPAKLDSIEADPR